jgi:hypothetical protein
MAAWWERALVVLATAVVLAVNGVASTRGINGVRTGEVAARYDLPFTPAGWAFSIWGAIYLALAAFTLYQLAGHGAASRRVAAVRPAYVFTGVANAAWLWFWHQESLGTTLAVMLLLLGALIAAYRVLRAADAESVAESWCVDLPFSLYLGWISVATIANLSVVVAYASRAGPLEPVVWSQLMLVALAGVVLLAWRVLRDPVFLVVLAWAAAGVALKPGQAPVVAVPAMLVAALSGMAAMGVLLAAPLQRYLGGAQSTTR